MARRLQKSTNRLLIGVAGGIADYFNVDPVIVRVIFIVLAFASGVGILLYVLLALLMPKTGASPAELLAVVKENLRAAPREATEAGRRAVRILRGAPAQPKESDEQASVEKDGSEVVS